MREAKIKSKKIWKVLSNQVVKTFYRKTVQLHSCDDKFFNSLPIKDVSTREGWENNFSIVQGKRRNWPIHTYLKTTHTNILKHPHTHTDRGTHTGTNTNTERQTIEKQYFTRMFIIIVCIFILVVYTEVRKYFIDFIDHTVIIFS